MARLTVTASSLHSPPIVICIKKLRSAFYDGGFRVSTMRPSLPIATRAARSPVLAAWVGEDIERVGMLCTAFRAFLRWHRAAIGGTLLEWLVRTRWAVAAWLRSGIKREILLRNSQNGTLIRRVGAYKEVAGISRHVLFLSRGRRPGTRGGTRCRLGSNRIGIIQKRIGRSRSLRPGNRLSGGCGRRQGTVSEGIVGAQADNRLRRRLTLRRA
jgi:hypothetical protein